MDRAMLWSCARCRLWLVVLRISAHKTGTPLAQCTHCEMKLLQIRPCIKCERWMRTLKSQPQ